MRLLRKTSASKDPRLYREAQYAVERKVAHGEP
jgi:hypothetical protein